MDRREFWRKFLCLIMNLFVSSSYGMLPMAAMKKVSPKFLQKMQRNCSNLCQHFGTPSQCAWSETCIHYRLDRAESIQKLLYSKPIIPVPVAQLLMSKSRNDAAINKKLEYNIAEKNISR